MLLKKGPYLFLVQLIYPWPAVVADGTIYQVTKMT